MYNIVWYLVWSSLCSTVCLVDPSLLSPCGHRACAVLTVKYLYDDDDDDDDGLSVLPCNLPASTWLLSTVMHTTSIPQYHSTTAVLRTSKVHHSIRVLFEYTTLPEYYCCVDYFSSTPHYPSTTAVLSTSKVHHSIGVLLKYTTVARPQISRSG